MTPPDVVRCTACGGSPGSGLREQNPAGIALIEVAQPRPAVPQVEGDTAFAGGALQAVVGLVVIGPALIEQEPK